MISMWSELVGGLPLSQCVFTQLEPLGLGHAERDETLFTYLRVSPGGGSPRGLTRARAARLGSRGRGARGSS